MELRPLRGDRIAGVPAEMRNIFVGWMTWVSKSEQSEGLGWMTWVPKSEQSEGLGWMTWVPKSEQSEGLGWMTGVSQSGAKRRFGVEKTCRILSSGLRGKWICQQPEPFMGDRA